MSGANDYCGLQEILSDRRSLARFYRFMEPAGLVVGGRILPNWMLDGTSFWYADGSPHDTVIYRIDGETGKAAPLFDVAKTRRALGELLGRELPYKGLPFDVIAELGGARYQFSFEGTRYVLSADNYAIVAMSVGTTSSAAGAPRTYQRPMWLGEPIPTTEAPSRDGCWFASVHNGNIMLRATADDRTVPLTHDGTPDFAWDIQSHRARAAAGVTAGQRQLNPWSPDSGTLFAIKVDRRAVPDLPFVRYLKREEELCSIKIQRAGGAMDIAHPHVIDVLSKRVRRLDLGDTENQFFALIGWLPDGSGVLFSRHSRDFRTVSVLVGNPLDGSVRVLFTESADTFVAIQHEVIYFHDNHAALLPDGSGLIWRSSRSGWNHFYLYQMDGTLLRPLTKGKFPVIDVLAVDQHHGWIYFTAHHDQVRPYDTHLCRVDLQGDVVERLTALDGQNVVFTSPTMKTFIAVNSRPDRPFRTDFYTSHGKHLTTVQHADVTALDALGYVAPEEFTVTSADGKFELWGVMYKPADFDPKKKYPVIDHLYAAPITAMVAHHFGLGDISQTRLDRALAQLGYIVISVDARGTPERSKRFQDVVFRNWGHHEVEDHVAAIRQLAQRHAFFDLDRVGVWGYSWGGYFAIRAMMQAADLFHVGVAVAPSTDPYDAILYEPYLDLPARAKAVYEHAKLYPRAADIVGKLMLVAGTCDPMVYSNTLEMVHYLVEAGVDHELVVLPEAGHNLQGKEDAYFVRKLVKHFELHLKRRKISAGVSMISGEARRRERVQSGY